jgi:hypothetical protein
MARIETRQFGAKRHVLIFAESGDECRMLRMLGGDNTHIAGEITSDDQWQPYIRLIVGKDPPVWPRSKLKAK